MPKKKKPGSRPMNPFEPQGKSSNTGTGGVNPNIDTGEWERPGGPERPDIRKKPRSGMFDSQNRSYNTGDMDTSYPGPKKPPAKPQAGKSSSSSSTKFDFSIASADQSSPKKPAATRGASTSYEGDNPYVTGDTSTETSDQDSGTPPDGTPPDPAPEYFEDPPSLGPNVTNWTYGVLGPPTKSSYEISGSALGQRRRIVYGTDRVTGHIIGILDNRSPAIPPFQHYVAYALCHGPVSSIDEIYINGELVSPSGATDIGYTVVEEYTGAAAQPVSPIMSTGISDWVEDKFGLCWILVGIRYTDKDGNNVNSLPQVEAKITRGDVTIWDATTQTSTNAVYALYDWWTSEAAMRRDGSELDTSTVGTGAETWDAVASWWSGKYGFNVALAGSTGGSNLATFYDALHSPGPVFTDGLWILWNHRDVASPTLTVTADDFAEAPTWKLPSLDSIPTHIKVDFRDSADEYTVDSIEAAADIDLSLEDENEITLHLPWCVNRAEALRWAKHRLNIHRLEYIRATLFLRNEAMKLLPGDTVRVTDRTGISATDFRVLGMSYREDMVVEVEVQLYSNKTDPGAQTIPSKVVVPRAPATGAAQPFFEVTTSTYTVTPINKFLLVTTNSVLTLPSAADSEGQVVTIKRYGATCRIDADSGDTIDGAASITLAQDGESVTLRCFSGAWYVR